MKKKKSLIALALAVGYLSSTLVQPFVHGEETTHPVNVEDHTTSPSTLSEETVTPSTLPEDTASGSTLPEETEDTESEETIEIDGVEYVKLTPIITTKIETRYKSFYRENTIRGYKYLDDEMQNLIKEKLESEVSGFTAFDKENLYQRNGKPAAKFVYDELGHYLRTTYNDPDSGKKYLIPIQSDDSIYVAPSVDLLYPKNKELCNQNTATIENWFNDNLVDAWYFEITDRNIKEETINGKIRYYYDIEVLESRGGFHTAKLRILNRFEDKYDLSMGNPWKTDFWKGDGHKNFDLLPYALKDEHKTTLVFDADRFNPGVDILTEEEKASIKQSLSRIWNNASWGISDMEVLGKGEVDGDPVIRLKFINDDGSIRYENLPVVSQETFYMHSFVDLEKYDISKLFIRDKFIYTGGSPNKTKLGDQDNIKGWLLMKDIIKEDEEIGNAEIKTIKSSASNGEEIYRTEITYPVIKNNKIVRRILINVTKPDEYPGDGSTQIVLSTPIRNGRNVTELDKAEIFRVLNDAYPEIKDIEMLNTRFFIDPHSNYAKTTVKVIYAGDKNSKANCEAPPACEINECTENHEFQNLLIHVYIPEKSEFTNAKNDHSLITPDDEPTPSLKSKNKYIGVLDPADNHVATNKPRTTAIRPLCGLNSEEEPEYPEPTCLLGVDSEGNPIGYDYCDTLITPGRPQPACPDDDCITIPPGTPSPVYPPAMTTEERPRPTYPSETTISETPEPACPPEPTNIETETETTKPTEASTEASTEATEPETTKPYKPASPNEITPNVPKPSTPIPPVKPDKPRITIDKNGEIPNGNHDIANGQGRVFGSNKPFYVTENGKKVYYTDRGIHTGDERNMLRNMLLAVSAFGLLILYSIMRIFKKHNTK